MSWREHEGRGCGVLYDRVAEDSGAVFQAKNDGVAIRNARIALEKVRADEHWLFRVAELDTESMSVVSLDKPVRIEVTPYAEDEVR